MWWWNFLYYILNNNNNYKMKYFTEWEKILLRPENDKKYYKMLKIIEIRRTLKEKKSD